MIATRQLARKRNTTTMKTRLLRTALIALLLAPTAALAQTEEVVFYHTDAIGSVRMITDATGAVLARYDFAPFGEKWDPQPNPDRLQFAGKERDTETGLDYFGARYYRPESGRFLSVDPVMDMEAALTDPQRWNRYSYSLNNPLTIVDPDGRNPIALLAALVQRAAASPAGQRAQQLAQQAYIWATRLGSSQTGQDVAAAVAEAATGAQLPTPSTIGLAAGTGASAFAPDRLQHASRALTRAGVLGNWSKATAEKFVQSGASILESPTATFDHVLRGNAPTKGFLGKIDGREVVILLYKTGDRAGQIATAFVPTNDQLVRWGLR